MSTITTSSRTSSVRWLIESRPPSLTWSRPSALQPNQPPLDLTDHESDDAEVAVPNDQGVGVSMVKARWAAKQRPGLPDARSGAPPCTGTDSVAAGPASSRSSHSLQMWPSDGQD